ncbi:MAG: hypothetical protein P8008_02490 [Gammaproteobacteria bacterium]
MHRCTIAVCAILLTIPAAAATETWFSDRQAELDAACEAARQKKLAPERERLIEECVREKQRPDRAACERFLADYGNRSGNRPALYYDLPECVEAFEYQKSREP